MIKYLLFVLTPLRMLIQLPVKPLNMQINYPLKNSPQNVIALDPGTDQSYVLNLQPITKDPTLPTQIHTGFC